MAINKIWHPFDSWEEFHQGMWRSVSSKNRKQLLSWAISFTGNYKLYGYWMRVVLKEWPISCEQNLSDKNQNRRAWLGHAAVCIALDIPEDITREAWGYLTKDQQELADNEADEAILEWEMNHERENKTLYNQMGIPGISVRNSRRSLRKIRGSKQSPILSEYMSSNFKKRHSITNTWLLKSKKRSLRNVQENRIS